MMKSDLLHRFLRYISVETISDEDSNTQPSTACQLNLLMMLRDELLDMGIHAEIDEFGYVMATIPANCDTQVPAIGFIAHVDTSPDASGKDIKPNIVENYDGNDIVLNKEKQIVLSSEEFPELRQYVGQTIITTDGTTLLGADDKAGVAEIMELASYLVKNKGFKHGEVKLAFTPDEEIGRGVVKFDVRKFGATYAYTMDGGAVGELEYENFNAACADIVVQGKNIHPGYAKGKMINSQLVAMELNDMLPENQRPENTDGYQGFFHLTDFCGCVEQSTMKYIIRDHSKECFLKKQQLLLSVVDELNAKYGNVISLDIRQQYLNMREMVEPHMKIVEIAEKAIKMAGINPRVQPVRGGTDGANLSFMGLPCPNIFAGGHNFHGRFEYVPLESMEKAVEVMKNILFLFLEYEK
ncbi:MAG: peptidase T [Bacteroidales bacterium]|nr:peptidase T [Bacteroidales bacterium]